jgi:hypothetical protein
MIDRKRVYSWANAGDELVGVKGYFGHSIEQLELAIEQGWLFKVLRVDVGYSDQPNNTFRSSNGHAYPLFLPVEK